MALAMKIKSYLQEVKIPYEVLHHSVTYTASETAAEQHIPGEQLIKSVLIKANGQFALCVLEANQLINFEQLQKIIKTEDVQLATEMDIARIFPDYDIGAETPFGHLHGLRVYMEKSLQNLEHIFFNGGTHTDLIKMKTKDYIQLENPQIASFGEHV
jgi:Ala-tRNA(Pro) deacylase